MNWGLKIRFVTRGLLNLTHRESHEHPAPLEPGRRYEVAVPLNAIAHSFPRGHRIRLAVSSCYWPMIWPSAEAVTLTLFTGVSRLALPVRPAGRTEDPPLRPFDEPEGSAPLPREVLAPQHATRTITRDLASGRVELVYAYGDGRKRLPNGIELEDSSRETSTIVEGDPLSAAVETAMCVSIGRERWGARVETRSTMRSDAAAFQVTNEVTVHEGPARVFARAWTFEVPRDLV
jgi:hypothetical protein